MDWGVAASVVVAGLALLGSAVSYGAVRQKVKDVSTRVDQQDARIHDIGQALNSVSELRGEVRTFAEKTAGAHELVLEKLEASDRLVSERLDRLREQIDHSRSFAPPRQRAPAKR